MNFTSCASIVWGYRITGDDGADRKTVATFVPGQSMVICNEAQFLAQPQLASFIRDENPDCLVALAFNALGVFDKPSDYFPTQRDLRALCESNGWWLRNSDGTRVIVSGHGWPAVGVVGWTAGSVDWLAIAIANLATRYNVDLIFLDECYSDPRPLVMSKPWPGDAFRDAWRQAMTRLIRKTIWKGTAPMVNGTIEATGAQPGRFWQNCQNLRLSQVLTLGLNSCWEMAPSARRIILHWQTNDSVLRNAAQALAALCDASCQLTLYSFSEPNPVPSFDLGDGQRDANGQPLLEWNGSVVSRKFDRQTLTLDLGSGAVGRQ